MNKLLKTLLLREIKVHGIAFVYEPGKKIHIMASHGWKDPTTYSWCGFALGDGFEPVSWHTVRRHEDLFCKRCIAKIKMEKNYEY